MLSEEINQTIMELSVEDRLELARQLIESVVVPASLNAAVTEGIHRLEDVVEGRTSGLSEEEFRTALR